MIRINNFKIKQINHRFGLTASILITDAKRGQNCLILIPLKLIQWNVHFAWSI